MDVSGRIQRGSSQKGERYKIILIGDPGVGKSSLVNQYVKKIFPEDYKPTITADYIDLEVTIDGKTLAYRIWDTAGMERFQSLGPIYYKGTDCCVLVYDVTKPKSFENMEDWMKEFIMYLRVQDAQDFPFVVVGTKADDEAKRQVPTALGKSWCRENGNIPFFEVSNKDSAVVQQLFEVIAKVASGQPKETISNIVLQKQSIKGKKGDKKDKSGCEC